MKRLVIAVAIIATIVLAVLIILPAFAKAKVGGGPGISGNLHWLQVAKDVWQSDGHTNEWPTGADLFPDWTRDRSLNKALSRRFGELYFINRTGAPPFAYIPKANGPYRGGEILIMTSNGLATRAQ
jgi:hypothetical protein